RQDRDRRAVRRGEGRGRGVSRRERRLARPGDGAGARLPHLRSRRDGRGARDPPDVTMPTGAQDGLGALFRHASGRMVSALVRVFGMHNLAVAEDAVQDALCRALEVWKFQGVPEKPGAWLMEAARRRAIDVLRKERTRRTFAPDVTRLLETEWT